MRRLSLALVVLFSLMLITVFLAPAQASYSVFFEPQEPLVQVGSDFSLDIYIQADGVEDTGFADGLTGMGFDIDLTDPLIEPQSWDIEHPSASVGSQWTTLFSIYPDQVHQAYTLLGASMTGIQPGSDGRIYLGNIALHCTGAGQTNIDLDSLFALSGGGGVAFTLASGTNTIFIDEKIDFGSATIHQSAVPVPPAIVVLGAGLVGIFGLRRRKIGG